MGKSLIVCVQFLPNVARQKLLKLANAAWSYSKNKSGTFFMDHGVECRNKLIPCQPCQPQLQPLAAFPQFPGDLSDKPRLTVWYHTAQSHITPHTIIRNIHNVQLAEYSISTSTTVQGWQVFAKDGLNYIRIMMLLAK